MIAGLNVITDNLDYLLLWGGDRFCIEGKRGVIG